MNDSLATEPLPSLKVGCLTVSDRASTGAYEDLGGPELQRVVADLLLDEVEFVARIVPDEQERIAASLVELCELGCQIVLTTGGTGPTPRDITPEATRQVIDKELPGFGEVMRMQSFARVPTSILSRATAGVRGRSILVNLPGSPKAIAECLIPVMPAIVVAVGHLNGYRPRLRPGGPVAQPNVAH